MPAIQHSFARAHRRHTPVWVRSDARRAMTLSGLIAFGATLTAYALVWAIEWDGYADLGVDGEVLAIQATKIAEAPNSQALVDFITRSGSSVAYSMDPTGGVIAVDDPHGIFLGLQEPLNAAPVFGSDTAVALTIDQREVDQMVTALASSPTVVGELPHGLRFMGDAVVAVTSFAAVPLTSGWFLIGKPTDDLIETFPRMFDLHGFSVESVDLRAPMSVIEFFSGPYGIVTCVALAATMLCTIFVVSISASGHHARGRAAAIVGAGNLSAARLVVAPVVLPVAGGNAGGIAAACGVAWIMAGPTHGVIRAWEPMALGAGVAGTVLLWCAVGAVVFTMQVQWVKRRVFR